jgi:hypothetical protein
VGKAPVSWCLHHTREEWRSKRELHVLRLHHVVLMDSGHPCCGRCERPNQRESSRSSPKITFSDKLAGGFRYRPTAELRSCDCVLRRKVTGATTDPQNLLKSPRWLGHWICASQGCLDRTRSARWRQVKMGKAAEAMSGETNARQCSDHGDRRVAKECVPAQDPTGPWSANFSAKTR